MEINISDKSPLDLALTIKKINPAIIEMLEEVDTTARSKPKVIFFFFKICNNIKITYFRLIRKVNLLVKKMKKLIQYLLQRLKSKQI